MGRVWLVELDGGDTLAIICTEAQADRGESNGLWTVIGSARLLSINEALLELTTK